MSVYYPILIFAVVVATFGQLVHQKMKANGGIDIQLNNNYRSISLFFALFSVSLLVFFAAMRTNYVDTMAYIQMFDSIPADLSELKQLWEEYPDRKGWILIQIIFKRFVSKDPNVFFAFIAIFQAGAVVSFFYKHSVNFTFSLYLFITSTCFLWMFNGIRQFTAVCLVMYFFDFLPRKKLIKFIIVVLLAYTIHSSVIIWIPVYFICSGKPWSPKIILFIALGFLTLISINTFTDVLSQSLEDTSYAGYTEQFLEDDGVNPLKIIIALIPPMLAFEGRKRIESYRNEFYDMLINLSVFTAGLYMLGMLTSGILIGRLPIYFQLCNYLLLPWLIECSFDGITKKVLKATCYIMYLLYFYFIMVKGGAGFYVSNILGIYDLKYFK